MSKNARHINSFLRRNQAAAGLLEGVQRDAMLLKATRRALAADLRPHCLHATLEDGRLSLLTDGPAWASRLRFSVPDLLAGLRAEGTTATAVRIRVAPQGSWGRTEECARSGPRLSAATALHLRRVAATLGDTDLAAALLRLAGRGEPPDQETDKGRGL